MNPIPLNIFLPDASAMAYGCMGLGGGWNRDAITREHIEQANKIIDTALEGGINFFDHADIYAFGKAEEVFGQVLAERPELRQQIYLQSKCGIRFADKNIPNRYDFSRDWIIKSVDQSLERLKSDHLDVLLLHRPDPLMQPEEVAAAFDELYASGKVHQFGVSNMSWPQMKFLQSFLDKPLMVNQLEMSLSKLDWLNDGVTFNTPENSAVDFVQGTVEFCRGRDVQLQSWGCLSQGLFSGKDTSGQPENIRNTAQLVAEMAEIMGVSREAIVLGWLTRHPADIQPVIGTTDIARIKSCTEAKAVNLSRDQWYQLFVSARGSMLP